MNDWFVEVVDWIVELLRMKIPIFNRFFEHRFVETLFVKKVKSGAKWIWEVSLSEGHECDEGGLLKHSIENCIGKDNKYYVKIVYNLEDLYNSWFW